MAGTLVPAKFEQGGFTSGRREGPQTLFPSARPGNRAGDNRRRNSIHAICTNWPAHTTRNFYWLVCKNRNARRRCRRELRVAVARDQLSRVSATLRSKKSRKTLIRFEERSS